MEIIVTLCDQKVICFRTQNG